MRTKIPATVVTGFLGAGKTTLIRSMLENAQGRRIALVVNEFGDLGVDGEILAAAVSRAARRTTSSSCRMAASAAPWPMTSCPRWSGCWIGTIRPTTS